MSFLTITSIVTFSIAMVGYGVRKILLNNNSMSLSAIKEVYRMIRDNGIGICYRWTNKISTNVLGKHLIEMHHKYYIVNYPYGVNWYKIIIPRKRGPCLIDEIVDAEGKDIKEEISAYLGPCYNFHGQHVTPEMLGQTEITFKYLDGDEKKFAAADNISL